ncbi:MAG: hypothetical protein HC905_23405 [Bacteroidales bacterium]|nr:hypothetical protein [Bacteroidales bacterium]
MRHYLIILLLCCFGHLWAGTGTINFVETTVELKTNGEATVAYTVQYEVLDGELHGFYFSGLDKLPVFGFYDESYAVDDKGNRYKLSISETGNGVWDIVLADGIGISSGNVTYVFYFTTNFNEAQYLVNTQANDGRKLVVFNWSPSEFDESENMDHYTLKVVIPFQVPSGIGILREYFMNNNIILTEKFVNEKFKIDYQIVPGVT